MTDELHKKVNSSIRLLQSIKIPDGKQIELCYSGGKDSDIILELTKMAYGDKFRDLVRPIYKNTTIDPPGTIKHCRDNGVEIRNPSIRFFNLVKKSGFPTRRARFCCKHLKEYKILDYAIQGIRRSESAKRAKLYKEPVICRIYGKKSNKAQVILPILEWDNANVEEFIRVRQIKLHPLYYDSNGNIDVSRRLGCIGCPLAADNGVSNFKAYPKMAKLWIDAGKEWWDSHPKARCHKKFNDIYELFAHNLFFDNYQSFAEVRDGLFGKFEFKKYLEDYFNIKL